MTFIDRFSNLFSNPSESFIGLDEKPLGVSATLFSLLISITVTVVITFLIMDTPDIKREMIAKQKERIEKSVADGTISKEVGEQQLTTINNFMETTAGKVFTVISPVFMLVIMFFLFALYYFIFAKFLGTSETFNYSSALSIMAILTLYSSIIGVVNGALMMVFGTMLVNLGPILLVSEFNSSNIFHILLSKLDLLMLFYLYLMVLGFRYGAKLSMTSSVLVVIIPYLLIVGIQVLFA